MYHDPVLLQESVAGLDIKKNGIYVDVTFGGGGHSKAILKQLGEEGKLFAFDQDKDALSNQWNDDRLVVIHQNFRHLKRFLKFYGVQKVDGILGDFGVSSHQFDEPSRGFSTRFEGELDMRMNADQSLSAHQVVNHYEPKALSDLFFEYGELRNSRGIANRICDSRKAGPINTTLELNTCLKPLLPKNHESKILAQVYQAIRIEVNQEMEVLKEFLVQTQDVVKVGGRLSLISYHSLEDRWVKRFVQNGCFEREPKKDDFGNPLVPFKKIGGIVLPSEQEIKNNSRARSAKLRVAKKI